jgi:single-strand DNA-binding protein
MNKVILMGRLTRDPEVKTTQNQVEVCSFTLAVDRRYKNADGKKDADFISCVAWRKTAQLLGQYFKKGSRLGVVGSVSTRTYDDKEGKKVYVTEVAVDEIEFIDSKKDDAGPGELPSAPVPSSIPDMTTPDPALFPVMDDDLLPFDL